MDRKLKTLDEIFNEQNTILPNVPMLERAKPPRLTKRKREANSAKGSLMKLIKENPRVQKAIDTLFKVIDIEVKNVVKDTGVRKNRMNLDVIKITRPKK